MPTLYCGKKVILHHCSPISSVVHDCIHYLALAPFEIALGKHVLGYDVCPKRCLATIGKLCFIDLCIKVGLLCALQMGCPSFLIVLFPVHDFSRHHVITFQEYQLSSCIVIKCDCGWVVIISMSNFSIIIICNRNLSKAHFSISLQLL